MAQSVIVGAGALTSEVLPELERDARRFLDKVSYDETSGCWLWTGCTVDGHARMRKKYPGVAVQWRGQFKFRGKTEYAHRAAWMIFRGAIVPLSLLVMHSECDNTICVNPWHLGLGTPLENTRDMMSKGRAGGWAARPLDDGSMLFLPLEDSEEIFSVF